jgi:hypothetical protein
MIKHLLLLSLIAMLPTHASWAQEHDQTYTKRIAAS